MGNESCRQCNFGAGRPPAMHSSFLESPFVNVTYESDTETRSGSRISRKVRTWVPPALLAAVHTNHPSSASVTFFITKELFLCTFPLRIGCSIPGKMFTTGESSGSKLTGVVIFGRKLHPCNGRWKIAFHLTWDVNHVADHCNNS